MTPAVCFKCGALKAGAFSACPACSVTPRLESELAFSLALCEHLSSASQLVHYANEIKNRHRLTVPDGVLAQAKAALKDPQLIAMLGLNQAPSKSPPPKQPQSSPTGTISPPLHALFGSGGSGLAFDEQTYTKAKPHFQAAYDEAIETGKSLKEFIRDILDGYGDAVVPYLKRWHEELTRESEKKEAAKQAQHTEQQVACAASSLRLRETALHRNPFWILGATSRDDRRRIVELAEEKSLALDHDLCQKARSDLTNPRIRLSSEIGWLPGVSPRRAEQLARQVLQDPMTLRAETGLPPLAHANLLAAAFEAVDDHNDPDDVAEFIQEMAYLAEDLTAEETARDVNEDRAVSGFPEIKNIEQVQTELGERKRYYRNAIKDALNRMSPSVLIEVMTDTVEAATSGGESHAPGLVDELVDSYEVETQQFLQKEAENVHKLIKATRDSGRAGEPAVKPLVDKLEAVTRNWEKVAHPIQLSTKARGIVHRPSTELAFSIRSLAVDLFNEHNLLTQSNRITNLLQELFSHVPELAERVEEDAEALQNIFRDREHAEARRAEWAQEITYRAEIGMVFKDMLSISPDGVSWKGRHFPLDAITRIRWGGVRHSVNGIPTGTTFTLAFGDTRSEAVVELKREDVYSTFVDKLWRSVGVRLLTELLEALKAGQSVPFGDAIIRDDGVTLTRHKFLGSEQVRLGWHQTHVWNADGSFVIGAKDDKKAYAQLPYIALPNVHILEQGIRMAFKKAGMRALSDLLKGN